MDVISELIDYRAPTPLFYRQFYAKLNDLSEANISYTGSENRFKVFTDGSMQRHRVGAGVYIPQMRTKMRFRLPDDCNILQAEIMAILRAVKWLRYHKIYGRDIMIITDSKTAIKSLMDVYTTSELVHECRTSLNGMACHSNIVVQWVLGHVTAISLLIIWLVWELT